MKAMAQATRVSARKPPPAPPATTETGVLEDVVAAIELVVEEGDEEDLDWMEDDVVEPVDADTAAGGVAGGDGGDGEGGGSNGGEDGDGGGGEGDGHGGKEMK